MTKDIIEIVSSIGISGLVVVVAFYLWLKKAITEDIVKPLITPIKVELDELKSELKKKEDKLEKIEEVIMKNTETLNELKTIFNLIKGKIEISFKSDDIKR